MRAELLGAALGAALALGLLLAGVALAELLDGASQGLPL